ncbi:MAG TPA: alkaline phosphatase family protein, partial [Verrucomicrobiae bacterium]
MSKCTQWVDKGAIECKAWANMAIQQCTDWADQGSNQCSQWADEGSNECSRWADEGSNECREWEEESYKDCCDWAPCSWFCDAFVWITSRFCVAWHWVAKWVCKAWYWLSKWVCKAWYWVAKWVCTAWFWLIKVVCTLWSWVAKLVCVAWTHLQCWWHAFVRWVGFSGKRGGQTKIKKVFVLMLENRSLDHMLGFSQIQGTDAQTGAPTSLDGLQPNSHSNIDPATGNPVFASTPADFLLASADKDPGHEFADTLEQLCGSAAVFPDPVTGSYPANIDNSGFIANYSNPRHGSANPGKCMQCFAPAQVPAITALAREFAVCDRWFSSMPGPTWPNRFFIHAASSGGLDDSPSTFETVTSTLLDGY